MSEAPAGGRTRRVRLVVAVLLTVLALALVTWKVEVGPILRALSGAKPALLVVAVAIALVVNTFASAEVLRQALAALGVRVPRRALLGATLENLSFQAALPLGGGHASRAFSLARGHGVDAARAALSVPLLLGLKLGALLVFCAVGAAETRPFVVGIAGVALALGIAFARQRYGSNTFALLRALAAAIVLTSLQIAVFGVVLAALGASPPVSAILLRFPLCLVLAKLPVTWMGFGTREAAVVALFAGLADPGVLAAAALLFGVLDQLVPGLFGLVFTPRFARRIITR